MNTTKRLSIILPALVLNVLFSNATFPEGKEIKNEVTSKFIFPLQGQHVHSSCIVELPNGDLLSCWFQGSGERTTNDVLINGTQ
jgi:hypothetical protein